MTHEDFKLLLLRRLHLTEEVINQKSKDYATAHDKLHHFKYAGLITSRTPAQALQGMMVKHVVSVFDMIEAHARGIEIDSNRIDEKIGDTINYLILLEAILKE